MDLWDRWNRNGGPKYPLEKAVQYTFRKFAADKRRGTRALDIGCGSGVHTWFLAREGFAAAGTDISAEGINNTHRRLAEDKLRAEVLLTADERQPYPDQDFSLVLCIRVLECIGQPASQDRLVAEVARLLRPGGFGLFLFASDQDYGYLHPELNGNLPFNPPSESAVHRMFDDRFLHVDIDRYITTYESGRLQSNHFLVTVAA